MNRRYKIRTMNRFHATIEKHSWTRFWQSAIDYGLSTILAFSLVTMGSPAVAKDKPEEKVLNVYNWINYLADDTIPNFEKETGIKVQYDTFDTNEILHAKLIARNTGYDIVVPSDKFAAMQIKAALFKKLDKSKLPNLALIDPYVKNALASIDPNHDYLVPWLWGFVTVGINTKKVKEALGDLAMPQNAWDLILNPTYASKLKSCGIAFMDSGSEVIPTALLYIGKKAYSKNPADYKEAGAMLAKIRPYIRVFSSSGITNDLANGSICAAMWYSGEINIARQRAIESKNGNQIEALIPTTPAIMFFDAMAIPSDAPHPDNALLWMNYIIDPKVQAKLSDKVFNPPSVLESVKYVSQNIRDNKSIFLPEADKKRMIEPEPLDPNTLKLITRTFTRFKTGI